MKKVYIVEDQRAVRELLAELLKQMPFYQLVGESGDGLEASNQIIEKKPDVVILDAKLPSLNGPDVLRKVRKVLPATRFLVFSGYQNPVLVRDMIEAGAHGFVEKNVSIAELKNGLDSVASGGTYFGPAVATALREVVANPRTSSSADLLTEREREILKLVAEGFSTKEIAVKLDISVKTADNHRNNLMKKLQLHNAASLTRYAIQSGLVEVGVAV
jgi:DNA-binding NarL/FixJ family response regulator